MSAPLVSSTFFNRSSNQSAPKENIARKIRYLVGQQAAGHLSAMERGKNGLLHSSEELLKKLDGLNNTSLAPQEISEAEKPSILYNSIKDIANLQRKFASERHDFEGALKYSTTKRNDILEKLQQLIKTHGELMKKAEEIASLSNVQERLSSIDATNIGLLKDLIMSNSKYIHSIAVLNYVKHDSHFFHGNLAAFKKQVDAISSGSPVIRETFNYEKSNPSHPNPSHLELDQVDSSSPTKQVLPTTQTCPHASLNHTASSFSLPPEPEEIKKIRKSLEKLHSSISNYYEPTAHENIHLIRETISKDTKLIDSLWAQISEIPNPSGKVKMKRELKSLATRLVNAIKACTDKMLTIPMVEGIKIPMDHGIQMLETLQRTLQGTGESTNFFKTYFEEDLLQLCGSWVNRLTTMAKKHIDQHLSTMTISELESYRQSITTLEESVQKKNPYLSAIQPQLTDTLKALKDKINRGVGAFCQKKINELKGHYAELNPVTQEALIADIEEIYKLRKTIETITPYAEQASCLKAYDDLTKLIIRHIRHAEFGEQKINVLEKLYIAIEEKLNSVKERLKQDGTSESLKSHQRFLTSLDKEISYKLQNHIGDYLLKASSEGGPEQVVPTDRYDHRKIAEQIREHLGLSAANSEIVAYIEDLVRTMAATSLLDSGGATSLLVQLSGMHKSISKLIGEKHCRNDVCYVRNMTLADFEKLDSKHKGDIALDPVTQKLCVYMDYVYMESSIKEYTFRDGSTTDLPAFAGEEELEITYRTLHEAFAYPVPLKTIGLLDTPTHGYSHPWSIFCYKLIKFQVSKILSSLEKQFTKDSTEVKTLIDQLEGCYHSRDQLELADSESKIRTILGQLDDKLEGFIKTLDLQAKRGSTTRSNSAEFVSTRLPYANQSVHTTVGSLASSPVVEAF